MALKTAIISIVATVGELGASLKNCVLSMWKAFDIRFPLFFGGLALLWYGIYSSPIPWLSYVVVGIILHLHGWLMGGKR
jgi:hypothetical protein